LQAIIEIILETQRFPLM